MYAIDTDGVQNASCQFDVQTLKPTYQLVIGFPGKSNAFEISRSLGIDEDIIKKANSLISSENKKFENILDDLEKTKNELDKNNRQAEDLKREAQALRDELEAEKEKFAKEKEDILERSRLEAQEIVRRVQRESQELVDELDSLRKEKEKDVEFYEGTIDKLLSNGKSGFVKDQNGKSYYFNVRDFDKRDARSVVEGLKVRFALTERLDKKKNEMKLNAISISVVR